MILGVCAVTSCAPPLGSIGGGVPYESIWAVPYRDLYIINDILIPEEDLLVFGSFRGAALPIDVNDVTLGIVEDPGFAPHAITLVPEDEFYLFRRSGWKQVVVYYGEASTRYSIEVLDPYEQEDPSIGGGGIGVIWWDGTPF